MSFERPSGDQLDNRYTYHPPRGNQPDRYELVRQKCRRLAADIVGNTLPGMEQLEALKNLDQVMFWANAAIAREP